MKINVIRQGQETATVEGREARAALREVLSAVADNILIPEPEFKRIVRRRMLDSLRAGQAIWSKPDENGQPGGTVLKMVPKIIGIIKEDGEYEEVRDGDFWRGGYQ